MLAHIMLDRFDHAVIAVRDLEQSITQFRDSLGLTVHAGGRHTGRGTHNAIIRFGLDYLELLSICDRDELQAAGARWSALEDYLAHREGGLAGYCLATSRIDSFADRCRQGGIEADGPFAMQRRRPDGEILSWRLLVPGFQSWRRPWPFFIQWDLSDHERLAHETIELHPIGALGVAGVSVVVADLDRAVNLYGAQFGLHRVGGDEEVPDLAVRRARFVLGAFAIDLLHPTGTGPAQTRMNADGVGVFEVAVRVASLDHATRFLADRGVVTEAAPGTPHGLLVPSSPAAGARLVLVA